MTREASLFDKVAAGLWISDSVQVFLVEMVPNLNSSWWQKDPGPTSSSFKPISLELGGVSTHLHMIRAGSPDLWSHRHRWTYELPSSPSPIFQTLHLLQWVGYGHWISQKAGWVYLFGPNDVDYWLTAIRSLFFCSSECQISMLIIILVVVTNWP